MGDAFIYIYIYIYIFVFLFTIGVCVGDVHFKSVCILVTEVQSEFYIPVQFLFVDQRVLCATNAVLRTQALRKCNVFLWTFRRTSLLASLPDRWQKSKIQDCHRTDSNCQRVIDKCTISFHATEKTIGDDTRNNRESAQRR